jgi:hypothetical protein
MGFQIPDPLDCQSPEAYPPQPHVGTARFWSQQNYLISRELEAGHVLRVGFEFGTDNFFETKLCIAIEEYLEVRSEEDGATRIGKRRFRWASGCDPSDRAQS